MPVIQWLIAVAVAYLLGAAPFSWLLGKARGVDIREYGSGNIGATNLGRVAGRRWGILGFALDVAKGFLPVFGAGLAFGWVGADASLASAGASGMWLAVAAAAMVGHVFPVYLGFKGGKGVATGFGVLLGVWPYLTLPACGALLTWVVFAGSLRYVGWASVIAAGALPGWFWIAAASAGWPMGRVWPFVAVTGAMGLLVIARHRGNLVRTVRGTEPKLGQ